MNLLIATVAQRPDLASLLDDFNPWPRFMRQDPVGWLYYEDPVTAYPEFVLVAVDRDHRSMKIICLHIRLALLLILRAG